MTDDGDEEDTVVNLQSRESVNWLWAARDENSLQWRDQPD